MCRLCILLPLAPGNMVSYIVYVSLLGQATTKKGRVYKNATQMQRKRTSAQLQPQLYLEGSLMITSALASPLL